MKWRKVCATGALMVLMAPPVAVAQENALIIPGDGDRPDETVAPAPRDDGDDGLMKRGDRKDIDLDLVRTDGDRPDPGRGSDPSPLIGTRDDDKDADADDADKDEAEDPEGKPDDAGEEGGEKLQFTETPSEVRADGSRFIDLTCGIGQSITDHQEVFGTPGAECVDGEGATGEAPEETPDAPADPAEDRGDPAEDRGEDKPDGEGEPEEKPEDKSDDADSDADADDGGEDKAEEPEDKTPDAPAPPRQNAPAPPAGGAPAAPPASTPKDEPKDDGDDSGNTEAVKKELAAMSDESAGIIDGIFGQEEVTDDDSTLAALLTAVVLSDEDNAQGRIEKLVADHDDFAGWLTANKDAVDSFKNADLPKELGRFADHHDGVEGLLARLGTIADLMGGDDK